MDSASDTTEAILSWKPVVGYPKYEVSNTGLVRRVASSRVLNPAPDRNGYVLVCLSNEAGTKRLLVHRLVAEAWLEKPAHTNYVHHIDENRSNNRLDNLTWLTQADNVKLSRSSHKPRSAPQPLPADTGRLSPVLEHEGYFVSDLGFVISYKRQAPCVLATCDNGDGYKSVIISGNNYKVHRLVADAFCSGRTAEKNVVNHIDRNRANNHHSNLEWTTPKGNRNHGNPVHHAKEAILEALRSKTKHQDIARAFDVHPRTVSRIARENGLSYDIALTEEVRSAILADLRNEVTIVDAAAKYSVGTTTIHVLAKANGVKPRGRRLKAETRDEALRLLATGLSQTSVAKQLGIDRGTVSVLVKQHTSL
jgi:transposase-like protein